MHTCGGDVEQWQRRWHEVADNAKPADPGREPPYLGLGAFQAADSGRFFGREKLVGQLLRKVTEHPFVGVFGASGSGKSSRRGRPTSSPPARTRWPCGPGPPPTSS
ncbi:nSTAND1 domain-containing NTPase [Lentzea flava]|uniref:nSTAND1 domain-containing NTPase n=1 Tax=Lentzea flava TaxID=103732 RepID=UPI0034D74528